MTSPQIREIDGVKLFAEITSENGLRWIDVRNVDSPMKSPYLNYGGFARERTNDRSQCIKDNKNKIYLGKGIYQKLFFPSSF